MRKIKELFKSKVFKISVVVLGVILGILFLVYFIKNDKISEVEMNFETNKGNMIYTEYKDLDKFYIKIPKDFEIMDDDVLKIKYPSSNRPKIVYTNEDGTINFAFNIDGEYVDEESLPKVAESVKSMFEKMGYFIYSSIFEVDGTRLYALKIISEAIDSPIYNYMVIFSIDNELITFSFNCTIEYMDEWEEVAEFIIKSIKLK